MAQVASNCQDCPKFTLALGVRGVRLTTIKTAIAVQNAVQIADTPPIGGKNVTGMFEKGRVRQA